MSFTLLICVILFTLLFCYTNGFHDSANSIATIVSTKSLSVRSAVIYGAALNFCGAFFGIQVAKTIGIGIVSVVSITQLVILSALLGATIWNFITWHFGLPSSSSHALIGGLIGAAIAHAKLSVINIHGVMLKIVLPMIVSPILGIIVTFFLLTILLHFLHKVSVNRINNNFAKLQIVSTGFMAFSHGANDTQKSVGIITMALINFYALKDFHVSLWVVVICAAAMAFGSMLGGLRIIKTMSHKIVKLKPLDGFAAETSTSAILLLATYVGAPVSTTQIISGAIIGAGSCKNLGAIDWGVFRAVIVAWILTIPFCALLSAAIYYLISLV